jgi:predicted regulator of Ras-like GTPase activity (Roadblock/LC7/MglB family)
MELEANPEAMESQSIEATFEEIFAAAMRKQPQIQHIVVSSEQGLVIAYKARTKGAEQQIAALSPVLGDAGESVFNALSLTPLGEIVLIGSEGTAYFARLKSAPAFLLVGAKGQVNVGLLRIIAADIESGAGGVLLRVLR